MMYGDIFSLADGFSVECFLGRKRETNKNLETGTKINASVCSPGLSQE